MKDTIIFAIALLSSCSFVINMIDYYMNKLHGTERGANISQLFGIVSYLAAIFFWSWIYYQQHL